MARLYAAKLGPSLTREAFCIELRLDLENPPRGYAWRVRGERDLSLLLFGALAYLALMAVFCAVWVRVSARSKNGNAAPARVGPLPDLHRRFTTAFPLPPEERSIESLLRELNKIE